MSTSTVNVHVAPRSDTASTNREARPITTIVMPFATASFEAIDASRRLLRTAFKSAPDRASSTLAPELQHIQRRLSLGWMPFGAMLAADTEGSDHGRVYGIGGELRHATQATPTALHERLDAAAGAAAQHHRISFGEISRATALALQGAATDVATGTPLKVMERMQTLSDHQDGIVFGWGKTLRGLAYLDASHHLLEAGGAAPVTNLARRSMAVAAADFTQAGSELELSARYRPSERSIASGETPREIAAMAKAYSEAWTQTVAAAKVWGSIITRG